MKVITDGFLGRSRGFAFVEMASEEEAKQAREKFNGCLLKDREMVVNEARLRRVDRGFSGPR